VRFSETRVAGAYLIEPEPIGDERGFFARTFCQDEFRAHGLHPVRRPGQRVLQPPQGDPAGMHYQQAPHQEAEQVRCTRGAIHDVVVDLREGSPSRRGWYGVELTAANRAMQYIPEDCAHGFLTLTDDAEVAYQMSAPYAADGHGVDAEPVGRAHEPAGRGRAVGCPLWPCWPRLPP
jgi:dTDP-4-dehydrorhamnose 3,5-epimerase